LIDFFLLETFCSVQKYIFCSKKPKFLLQIDLSGILNCNAFSVVSSISNENAKNALFLCIKLLFAFTVAHRKIS